MSFHPRLFPLLPQLRLLRFGVAILATTLLAQSTFGQFANESGAGERSWSTRLLLDTDPAAAQTLAGSAEVGGIFLSRSGAGAQPFVFDQDNNVLLDVSDLDGDFGAGVLFKFAIRNVQQNRPIDFEFEMFSIDRIAARQTVTAEQVVPVFFNSIPVTPVETETIEYVSDLQNYEFNLGIRCLPRVRLFAGARIFSVDEKFDVYHDSMNGTVGRVGNYSTTRNELFGGQVGVATTFWRNDFASIYGSAKVAFMKNDVEGLANTSDVFGNELDVNIVGSETTQLYDFEIGAYTSITDRTGLKAGYRGLIAEDIAFAPDQSTTFNLFGASGDMIFSKAEWHGFFVSFEAVW